MSVSWDGHLHLLFQSLVLSCLDPYSVIVLLLDGLLFYLRVSKEERRMGGGRKERESV